MRGKITKRAVRTQEFFEGLGRLYILPALGSLPVANVAVRDVVRLHYDLCDKPGTANRIVQLVKAFFYWLERRELFSGRNPARGVELYSEKSRERFLTVEEMARLGQALRVAETVLGRTWLSVTLHCLALWRVVATILGCRVAALLVMALLSNSLGGVIS